MSRLLGVSLDSDRVTVTVVDRHGLVVTAVEEPIADSVEAWTQCHPEEYYRAVVAALTAVFREGAARPRQVAAIGLAGAHAVALLDPECDVIPPREVDWKGAFEAGGGTLRGAMDALPEVDPRACKRAGLFFSLLDYVRFRMTGALATHESFVVELGATAGIGALDRWEPEAHERFAMRRDAFPPIFPAPWKIGTVGADLIAATGVAPGVWVNAGSDPVSAELLTTVEPVPGTSVLRLESGGPRVYRAIERPEALEPDVLPLAVSGIFYRRLSEPAPDPRGRVWTAPDESQWTIDFREPGRTQDWPDAPEGDVWFAWDSGGPSAGPAIQAGLGVGWWRDLRALWRKRRAPIDYLDWVPSLD